jgi:hypothetical protein
MSNLNPPPPPPPPPGPGIPGAPGGGDLIYPSQPPKDPILVLVLNLLLLGGVGYIIMGQKTKGIVAIVAWIVLTVVTCGIGSVIAIATAIDGYMQAQQLQQGHPIGQWTWFNNHA